MVSAAPICGNPPHPPLSRSSLNLWLHSPWYDLFFFQLTGFLCLLLIIPYRIYGADAVIPIYNFYLIFFGMPHNFLTWLTLWPKNVRQSYNLSMIKRTGIICFLICLLLPLGHGSELEGWVLSLITYASLWHAYRQHHGIMKIYDVVQAERSGDWSILKDRSAINLFFALVLFAVVVWAFTHEQLLFLLSTDEMYHLVYPRVPWHLFQLYLLVTALIGVYGLKRSLWDRWRAQKWLPWPQFGVMVMAIATFVGPYFFVPIEALPVAVAIGTIFHNIQYFVFVWLFESHRSHEIYANPQAWKEAFSQTWARKGQWKRFFMVAFLYSFLIIGFYLITPRAIGMTIIYFLAFAHYIIDGQIWQGRNNSFLKPVLSRIAQRG